MVIGLDASRANLAQRTGTERYAFEVIRRLPSLLPTHHFVLYTRETPLDELTNLGPNVDYRALSWPLGFLWSHLRLSWELWRRPVDLLFVPANTVPLWHPRRVVTTIHDVAFERFPELYRGRSVQRKLRWMRPVVHLLVRVVTGGRYSASERDYHRWSSRHAVRVSRRLLTVSNFSKQEIVATLGADPGRIVVTPLGVPPTETWTIFQPDEIDECRQRLNLVRPYFLFMGRLETKKNIDGLVKAYLLYRQHVRRPCDLVLMGQPGFGWENIIDLANQSIRQGFLHQLGWANETDKAKVLLGARAFFFPSRYEGFGIPAVEAQIAGIPVVASRVTALPEVLGPGAYWVNPDSIEDMAKGLVEIDRDEHLRQELIATGRRWSRRYSWVSTAQQTARVLESAAALPDGS